MSKSNIQKNDFGQNQNGKFKNKEVSKFLVLLKAYIGDICGEQTNFKNILTDKIYGMGKSQIL